MGITVRLWLLPLAVAVAAAGVLSGSGVAAGPAASTEQLALMPLQKSHLPDAANALPLDRKSGVVTNQEAAGDATTATAGALTRLGRLTGYELDYVDSGYSALAKGRGLLGVETSVALYRDAKAARKGMAFWLKEETRFAATKPAGVTIDFDQAAVPRVGQERWSFAGSVTVKGQPTIYAVDIVFRVGALVGDVTVTAADPKSGRAIVASLARKLETRIRQVLSGKITGPPVELPAKPKPGPPDNGMDLRAMAIKPADLGGGKIVGQGYRLDPDLNPVSGYVREIADSPFDAFQEMIELFHSPLEARFAMSALTRQLTVNLKAKSGTKAGPNAVVAAKSTPVDLPATAAEDARAVLISIELGDGRTINQGFVLVRVGGIVASVAVWVPGNVKIPKTALVQLATLAAQRINLSLTKSGVA